MSKSRLSAIFILVFLATSITFAQSFFSSTPAAGSTATAPAAAKPLSPEDFQSLVKQQSQQTQTQMNKQATQSLSAQPPFQPPSTKPAAPTDIYNSDTQNLDTPPPSTQSQTTTTDSSTTTTEETPSTTPPAPSSQPKSGLGIQY
jgi:hypothetical protein